MDTTNDKHEPPQCAEYTPELRELLYAESEHGRVPFGATAEALCKEVLALRAELRRVRADADVTHTVIRFNWLQRVRVLFGQRVYVRRRGQAWQECYVAWEAPEHWSKD